MRLLAMALIVKAMKDNSSTPEHKNFSPVLNFVVLVTSDTILIIIHHFLQNCNIFVEVSEYQSGYYGADDGGGSVKENIAHFPAPTRNEKLVKFVGGGVCGADHS